MKKSAHQIWKESKEQNLSKEEFKEKLKIEGVIVKKMTKQEKIKHFLGLSEPWSLDSVLEKLAEASNILLHRYNYDGIHWEEISHCVEKSVEYRKRLEDVQVLQINNEWIKIESEEDLPEENGNYWVMKKDYTYPIIEVKHSNDIDFWMSQFTHYQPITKPKLPLY